MSTNAAELLEKEEKSAKDTLHLINFSKTLKSKKLDLSRKKLYDVPTPLLELNHLEFLYLEGNCLLSLPENFFTSLTKLKWLDLRKNQLKYLPSSIGESRCLRSLLLEDNKLERLPLELGLVRSLSGLHVAENPLEFPPPSVIELGTQAILGYLRDHLNEKINQIEQDDLIQDFHYAEEEISSTKERDRAPRDSPSTTESSLSIKLPPIVLPNEFKDENLAEETHSTCDSKSSIHSLASIASSEKIKDGRKGDRKSPEKSPEKSPRKKFGVKKEEKLLDSQKESKSSLVKPAISPTKTSPKRKKKGKKKSPVKSDKNENNNIMTASLKDMGTFDVNYETTDQNTSSTEIQRQDTMALNEKYKEIIEEEKKKMFKVHELIKEEPENTRNKPRSAKFDVDSLAEGDMVAIKVADKHYIPGQPCLGKIVSLPDKTGLVLVHYYSGSYDGVWRPMMSRSSPYLRRIPASMIILKFELTEDLRMTADTIERLKIALEEITA